MMWGVGNIERVIESMKLGAQTFLQKPFDFDTLTVTLEQASRMAATQRELMALRRADSKDVERISGSSRAIGHINEILEQIARGTSPEFMEGESGTQKAYMPT